MSMQLRSPDRAGSPQTGSMVIVRPLQWPVQVASSWTVSPLGISRRQSPDRAISSLRVMPEMRASVSREAAQSAWTGLQRTAPDLFMGANLDIQRADLGAKGVFFRLRVGSFADREAATGFCSDVKAAGKDCMVVAKASG